MISEADRNLLGELATLAHGKALRKLLEEEIEQLKDVSNCVSWEDTLGRQQAVRTLRKILYFLDKPDTKPVAKSQYK